MLLKKTLLPLLLSINFLFCSAQKDEYAGKYLGWMKMFNPNEPQKVYTVDHHTYSVKQMGISQMLVSWVQQSYTPKGALGRAFRLVNNKIGLYTPEEKSKPHIYGTTTKTLIELKKNPSGQWIPETGTSWFMEIAVNGELGDYTDVITTGDKYFFHLPGDIGLKPDEQKVADLRGFSSHPVLKKYISWYQPKGIRTTLQYVVLLCKDNVKPYVQLTKGEYLDELEKAIDRKAKETYKWIAEEKAKNSRYNASITEEELVKRKEAFVRLKEKYRNRLNEPAKLKMQPDIQIQYEGSFDVFENPNYPNKYPVYKFDPAKLALTKTDAPQWIVIRWDAEGVATGNEAGTHLHQSMLDNIDYDYIYNYFFYPEKVKGIPYKPLNAPNNEEKIVAAEKSALAKKMETDASVFFFEDFSSTPEGKTPLNWNSTLNTKAKKVTVHKGQNKNETWAEITGNYFHVNKINKTFPQNFTASFDVYVRQNFKWGAPALEFNLVNEKAKNKYDNVLRLYLRPGFSGREGFASLIIQGDGKNSSTKEMPVANFSNDKPVNRVSIKIKKYGQQLQLFADNVKIYEDTKAFPAGFTLNHMYFYNDDSGWEVEEYHVTNLKIKKD